MSRPRRTSRRRAVGACAAALVCVSLLSALLSAAIAEGGAEHAAATRQRIADRSRALRVLTQSRERAPRAHRGRCARATPVPGQGLSCRTADGMFLLPQSGGPPLLTHGPDIVAATRRSSRSGGFGSVDSIACSPSSRSRHVVLAYLLPSDHATGAAAVHGDRFATAGEELRQALLDAATLVDRRAGELAPGQRRRLRVLCDDDGRPSVQRVVLPRTAATYLESTAGFSQLGDDLEQLGLLPQYDGYASGRVPSVRRLLAYYDADFAPGYAGQATMFRRSSLLRQGMSASDPLVSRTTRNINNNPPGASLAVQYGTRDATGTPDPPLYTSLLHELSHTMGAVQDEPPTSSDAGHCTDGLDLMCYDDTGRGDYRDDACVDAAPPVAPEDEPFDCNGDTYFHPAPPVGNPLASATTWQLGLAANETLSGQVLARPASVAGLRSSGTGTLRTIRWSVPAGSIGSELSVRRAGGAWTTSWIGAGVRSATPSLVPSASLEVRVAAVGRGLLVGPGATITLRTGLDTSPPSPPTGLAFASATRTSVRLRYVHAADNVRVTRYRVERREGARWVPHATVSAPLPRVAAAGTVVLSPVIGALAPAAHITLRLRALDARANVSTPSAAVVVTTRR